MTSTHSVHSGEELPWFLAGQGLQVSPRTQKGRRGKEKHRGKHSSKESQLPAGGGPWGNATHQPPVSGGLTSQTKRFFMQTHGGRGAWTRGRSASPPGDAGRQDSVPGVLWINRSEGGAVNRETAAWGPSAQSAQMERPSSWAPLFSTLTRAPQQMAGGTDDGSTGPIGFMLLCSPSGWSSGVRDSGGPGKMPGLVAVTVAALAGTLPCQALG